MGLARLGADGLLMHCGEMVNKDGGLLIPINILVPHYEGDLGYFFPFYINPNTGDFYHLQREK